MAYARRLGHDVVVGLFVTVGGTAVMGYFAANYHSTLAALKRAHVQLSPLQSWLASLNLALVILMVAAFLAIFATVLVWALRRFAAAPGVPPIPLPPSNVSDPAVNPLDSYFSKKQIRLIDLLLQGESSIRSKTFEECHLIGPAIIGFRGSVVLEACNWNGPSMDAVFHEVPSGTTIVGPIGIVDCVFRRCNFRGIGMMGVKADVDKWKQSVTQRK